MLPPHMQRRHGQSRGRGTPPAVQFYRFYRFPEIRRHKSGMEAWGICKLAQLAFPLSDKYRPTTCPGPRLNIGYPVPNHVAP